VYTCLKCGTQVPVLASGSIRCPSCGYKVFSKTREPISKTVKAI